MRSKKKILLVLGTRPEAIKLAPVIDQLKNDAVLNISVCSTGQHKELTNDVLQMFGINIDYNLNLMSKVGGLHDLLALGVMDLKDILNQLCPDLVLCHGDTTSTLIAALGSFYNKLPIAHVEAGLRTNDLKSPWPEEGNRKLVGSIASLHFAPTEQARKNLLAEGISKNCIEVTGNTVIDAVRIMSGKIKGTSQIPIPGVKENFILISCHRRENFGNGLAEICQSIGFLARKYRELQFVFPVHPNPNIKENVTRLLTGHQNVFLTEPMHYADFILMMRYCRLIMTDSGGIQEEAPFLNKPVLVMREKTERPEAISAGTAIIIGNQTAGIIENVERLLHDVEFERQMQTAKNPFGDGFASERIAAKIYEYLGVKN